jgi:C4-dicarboxylate transporter DctM subunit
MSVLSIGLLYGGATLVVMFIGMPIAFALGAVATLFMIVFMPKGSVDTITQNVYEEMASITLLSIPLFILKGSAIGRSRAGQDLYGALHAWMHWIPGGLGIANVFACALFAAMAGSSPATCSAIGSAGIPEMAIIWARRPKTLPRNGKSPARSRTVLRSPLRTRRKQPRRLAASRKRSPR